MFSVEEVVAREREVRELRERVARLEAERNRLAEALAYALVHYTPSVSAEAEILAFLNGYDGAPDIVDSSGLGKTWRDMLQHVAAGRRRCATPETDASAG